MADLYQTLGVAKGATQAEIKKAYHKIARTSHPDVTKNDPAAANRFKEASCAYDILSDANKRKQYDAGEIDDQGKPRAPFSSGFPGAGGGGNPFGGGRTYTHQGGGGQGFEGFDFADLFGGGGGFGDIFGQMGRGGAGMRQQQRGQDVSYSLTIPFELSITGGETSIRLSSGKQVKVKIPAGVKEGATLRLRGQGEHGGDALIKISVGQHPLFTREGDNVYLTLPVTLKEAVLGAKIMIPTLTGRVSLTVPPNSSSGKILRLPGKGVTGLGDLLVRIQVILPDSSDKELEEFVKNWRPKSQDPRAKF